ncbi:probable serine/threonine-protein kinase pknB, partial [Lentisphaera araneosa HTCC2155]
SIKRAFDLSTSRYIAFAERGKPNDKHLYEVFLREARLTALLEHPNIISIHDVGLNDLGQPYFTMDLKEGDSLGEIFKNLNTKDEEYLETYSLHELLMIFVKICEAISYAHSKNIIHLDLKPDNIQVGHFGEVLVCDWGLGKILNNTEIVGVEETLLEVDLLNHISSKNKVVGTPGYMSPEQINLNGDI